MGIFISAEEQATFRGHGKMGSISCESVDHGPYLLVASRLRLKKLGLATWLLDISDRLGNSTVWTRMAGQQVDRLD